jgi:hypothetical protein
MKKYIYLILFLGVTNTFAQRTDFGVFTINAPANGAILYHGQVHLSFVATNKNSVGVANSDSFYLWARINTNGTPVMIDAYSQIYLTPNNSITLTSDLLYLDSSTISNGNYQLGLGIQWKKNPNSGAIYWVYNNFYFSHTSIMEDFTSTINRIYYTDKTLHLQLQSDINQQGKLMIINSNGQLMKTQDLILRAGTEQSENIDCELPSGIYLVYINTREGVSSRKFIVW